MRDVMSIFTEQEKRLYEKLPLAAACYLVENNEIEIILVSDDLCEFLNVEREKILGKLDYNKYTYVHKDDLEKIKVATEKFTSGETEKFDVTYRVFSKGKNKYVWHHIVGKFLDIDSDDKVAMITFENIDQQIEQAKVQASLNLKNEAQYNEAQSIFSAIIQQQTEYVVKFDEEKEKVIMIAAKGNFVGFKEGYSELTFKEYEGILKNSSNVIDIYGGKRFYSCKECLACVKEKAIATTYIIKKDGKKYYKFSLFFRGQQDKQLYSMIYDITDLSEKEYDRAEELKKANDAKSEFLSRMSHDMRTPLGAVIATANFGIDETKDEKAREYFKEISNYSKYLLSIINDLLEVQKISNSKVKLIPSVFEIDELNKEVREIVLKSVCENNVKIVFSDNYPEYLKYVKMDKQRLEQILINLLNNAIKYTPKGGIVKGTCSFEQDGGTRYLKYVIEDNGVGMSEEFQNRMFETFTREENEFSCFNEGSGLGLSIVKNIIDLAGGDIKCKSKIGVGTVFTVKLPIVEIRKEEIEIFEKKKENHNGILKKEDLKGKKILLVEDIEINRKIAKKILINMGVIVSVAVNGQEAVESVEKNDYDLVLMDVRMPVMGGIEATIAIRKFNEKIPIIGLSANAFLEDINKSLEVGMNDYLAKPIDRKKLSEILLKYC